MKSYPQSAVYDLKGREEPVLKSLRSKFSILSESLTADWLTYYDTFDWRLHRHGRLLRVSSQSKEYLLCCENLDGDVVHEIQARQLPAFAWDLPEGGLRSDLERIIQMRRLLPVVRIRREGQALRVLDKQRKTVARLFVHSDHAGRPQGSARARPLPALLRVSAIRGYEKAFEKMVAFAGDELGLHPSQTHRLDAALEAIGRRAREYSSKISISLKPDSDASQAVRAILRQLLSTMLANEEGTRRDWDSEFLHDFRVAGRRTRVALTQIKGVLPEAAVERYKKDFAWLGKVTGPKRDLDVYLLKIPDYQAGFDDVTIRNLALLEEFLRAELQKRQRSVQRALRSARYQRLVDSWREFLGPEDAEPRGPKADSRIDEVAAERILRVYRRVLKRGGAIRRETPAQAVHDLRIDCKKLRYLLEFFRSLYPRSRIGILIKELKRLQDNLGDFNDYEVHHDDLVGFAGELMEKQAVPAQTLLAMGQLVARLRRFQSRERAAFSKAFSRFVQRSKELRFEKLLAPAPGKAVTS